MTHRELEVTDVRGLHKNNKEVWEWVEGMYVAGSDDLIGLRLWSGVQYEPVTRDLWGRLCKGAKFVVDVGAHTGIFTLDAWKAGCENVLSIEPHPVNYARLVMNLKKGGFSLEGLFFGAVGDYNGIGSLGVTYHNLQRCASSGLMNWEGDYEQVPVRVKRLDSLIGGVVAPSAIKIDVENWGLQVLKGMEGILKSKPDLIMECLSEGMDQVLRPYGYRFWEISEDAGVEEVKSLKPNHSDGPNFTDMNKRNRFCSVKGLPD